VRIVASIAMSAVLLLALAPLAITQDFASDPRVRQSLTFLELWLDGQRAYEQIPGVSAGIVHNQQLLWAAGFGYADRERGIAATPETVYSICSISKLFTSVAIMQLRDEGKLRLDDPAHQHLLWFAVKELYPESAPITIESLLTHSAGLQQDPPIPYWSGAFAFPTREQIQASLRTEEMLLPAQRYYEYSNTGFILAGEIVAAASGMDYAQHVRARIIEPLGLTSTTPEMPVELSDGRLARGYSGLARDGVRIGLPLFQTNGVAPAAGFASSARDLARFAAWQFRLLSSGGSEVLAPNTLREMHRVHRVDADWSRARGLGFRVWRSGDRSFVGHDGDCPGFRTAILLQPDERIATVFLSNASGIASEAFAQQIYDIVGPAIRAAAAGDPLPPAPDASLAAFQGIYDYAPWGGEMIVFPWEDGLAAVDLPSTKPREDMFRLRAVPGEQGRFRRVRKDGNLGERIDFTRDADGRVLEVVRYNNPFPKVMRIH
jgi:CubicO group peptidase (beta-lactamase class C family)